MPNIPISSIKNREAAELIDGFLNSQKLPHHWENTNGGHYRCVFTYKGETRSQTIAKTPGDHRGGKNALTDLKRILYNLGWEPVKPEKVRVLKVRRASLKDVREVDLDVSSVLDEHDKPLLTLRGLVVPPCPDEYAEKRLPLGRQKGELADALAARRAFAREVFKRGASDDETCDALVASGWYMTPTLVASIRNRKSARDKKAPKNAPEALHSAFPVPPDDIGAKLETFAGGALGFIEIEGNIHDTMLRLLKQLVQLHTVRLRRELDETKAELDKQKARADALENKATAYDRIVSAAKAC